MMPWFQLQVGGQPVPVALGQAAAVRGGRGERGRARRNGAGTAGQPHGIRRPAVHRRRHVRAVYPGVGDPVSRGAGPVHLRRLRAVLAAAHGPRVGSSTIRVWAQDASWLMNVDDKVREWPGLTDGQVANSIFASYASSRPTPTPRTTRPLTIPASTPCSSAQRIFSSCTLWPGAMARSAGWPARTGPESAPATSSGPPWTTLPPRPSRSAVPTDWTVDALDLDWDIMRPTEADASQVSLTGPASSGVPGNATSSGLTALGARDLAAYAGRSSDLAAHRHRGRAGTAAAHGRGAARSRVVRPLSGRSRSRPARDRHAGRHRGGDQRGGHRPLRKVVRLAGQQPHHPGLLPDPVHAGPQRHRPAHQGGP